jgi:predicted nucleotide-binding protein
MKALAWDDEPQYMEILQTYLDRFGIHLEIVSSEDAFVDRFFSGEAWDFIVTDLVLENSPVQGETESVGSRLAHKVTQSEKGRNLPVFMITGHFDRLNALDMNLPPGVVVKSKSTYPGWLAGEIRQELARRGLYVDRRKVFLIYGHDREAGGTRERVISFLKKRGVEVITLGDSALRVEIAQGLLNKMNECGAFLAICTPDDTTDKVSQPRSNVFIEIGLALGLSGGVHRLVILQKWGPEKKLQASLPTDLQGFLTIQFEGQIDLEFEKLAINLRTLGIELQEATD